MIKNKKKGNKLIFLLCYLCLLALILYCSTEISNLFGISDRLALLFLFLSIFVVPVILFVVLFFSLILGEILSNSFQNISRQFTHLPAKDNKFYIFSPYGHKLLKISNILFSEKTQKEVFQEIVGEWDEELFIALIKKENQKLLMINIRNSYRFLLAMWQKSPIGDLIEFIMKVAK